MSNRKRKLITTIHPTTYRGGGGLLARKVKIMSAELGIHRGLLHLQEAKNEEDRKKQNREMGRICNR